MLYRYRYRYYDKIDRSTISPCCCCCHSRRWCDLNWLQQTNEFYKFARTICKRVIFIHSFISIQCCLSFVHFAFLLYFLSYYFSFILFDFIKNISAKKFDLIKQENCIVCVYLLLLLLLFVRHQLHWPLFFGVGLLEHFLHFMTMIFKMAEAGQRATRK